MYLENVNDIYNDDTDYGLETQGRVVPRPWKISCDSFFQIAHLSWFNFAIFLNTCRILYKEPTLTTLGLPPYTGLNTSVTALSIASDVSVDPD